jgi:hypothetical protein
MFASTFSLTLALAGGEWSASRPCRFTPCETAPGTHWIGGWVDTGASLPGLELQPLGSPARSQSLYRLRYPGSYQRLTKFHENL